MFRVQLAYGFSFFLFSFWVTVKSWKLEKEEALQKVAELTDGKFFKSVDIKKATICDNIPGL